MPKVERWVLSVIVLGGCFVPPEQSTLVGPEGGTVRAHGVELSFPPGAVSQSTRVTIERVSVPPPAGFLRTGDSFLLGPEGTQFERAVQVSLPLYDPLGLPPDRSIEMATAARSADRFEVLPAFRNGSHVVASVSHFSVFIPVTEDGHDGGADGGTDAGTDGGVADALDGGGAGPDAGMQSGADAGVDAGATAGPMDAGEAIAALDAFCRQLPAAYCEYFIRCGRYDSLATCEPLWKEADRFAQCGRAEKAAIKDGRAAFDASKLQRCLDGLQQTFACSQLTWHITPPDCDGFALGLVPNGAACWSDFECQNSEQNYCVRPACPRTCAPRTPVGGIGEPYSCVRGAYLYGSECRAFVPIGGSCAPVAPSYTPQTCVPDAYCDSNTNICVTEVTVGGSCGLDLCSDELHCIGTHGNRTCQTFGSLGQPCANSDWQVPHCKTGLRCDALPTGACAPQSATGGPCMFSDDCVTDHHCLGAQHGAGGGTPAFGTCELRQGDGGACTQNWECLFGYYCTSPGTCARQLSEGEPCTGQTLECSVGLNCSNGSCVALCADPTP